MRRNKAATSDGEPRPNEPSADQTAIAAGQLRAFIERIERLLEDRAAIAEDIAELYAEIKGTGFDTQIVRQIVKLRKMDTAQRQELEAKIDLYKHALGMA